MKKELIEKLIGRDVRDISYWEEKFPSRGGRIVTRFAPSPTGFAHIGNIYTCLLDDKFAHQQNGVLILRIEDTDGKRKVDGAVELIISSLRDFKLFPDEGPVSETEQKGAYGPYFQSERRDIYLSGVKYLLEKDLAYPCFATEEEMENLRREQTALKVRPGYYGKWAKCRNLSEEQVEALVDEGKPYVFRFKAGGDWDKKRYYEDAFRGKILMPENDMDIVLLKKDGLPTYHFAHIMDDHFMRTTHVIRTDEWLASLPLHVQMFESIGWELPKYVHAAPIQKLDEGNKRKLSKRKDPEANVAYYLSTGYPVEAVKDYLLNLLNSNFEDYKKEHPQNALETFELKLENLNASGPLLDMKKLENIGKEFIATLSSDELYDRYLAWAKEYNPELAGKIENNKDYIKSILAIERDGAEKVRKDFYVYSKIWDEISYFFDEAFIQPAADENGRHLIRELINSYDEKADKDAWFENIKRIAAENGYAKNAKEKDKEPGKYKGTLSDVATVFRLAITGRTQSPDLYAVMRILGQDRVMKRLKTLI